MQNEAYYFIEDIYDEFAYAPKIIRKRTGFIIERYDFIKKEFVEDTEMAQIYFGGIEVNTITEQEAYEAIEKFTKRFYS